MINDGERKVVGPTEVGLGYMGRIGRLGSNARGREDGTSPCGGVRSIVSYGIIP